MKVEKLKNKICVISLDDSPINSLKISTLKIFDKVLDDIESSSNTVLIIQSSSKHFCAGADLKERSAFSNEETVEFLNNLNRINDRVSNLELITISSINGACLGGGLELALSTDFRIASNDAILGFPETSIGIIPGAGGTQRLTRICGQQIAMKWIFTADKYTSQNALIDKVVDFCVPLDDLRAFSLNIASSIVKNAPIALKAAKKAIQSASAAHGFALERDQYLKTLISNDRNEGLLSFKEKRPPKWSNT